ncbi:NADPH:quinone reductase or related Zn-dependent oxidoreductase [Pseudomonas syringae pv. actinidiae]|uniref:NADPH:quinone reductase or related Zn-dependent oxidoreductase n=1 Tax=Pseudomonas syringae pv. actinidiae TaxID=103796 RepID=A0AAN4Q743_PSESF|nr:NADPH:quinone reductase or related Zn-dependent oxidoreductase [Pseudomonas syringae pv. actinidiae]
MDRQVVLNPPVANFKLVDRPIDHPWRARMLINVVTFAKRWRVDAPAQRNSPRGQWAVGISCI